jgi:hypothetical protein
MALAILPRTTHSQDVGVHFKMKFDKTSEHTIRFDNSSGYFLIREFQYNERTSNPIAEFMKTRYFSWNEEFRNEFDVTADHSDQLSDWNFHGLYDIKKLRPVHFIRVNANEFVKRFMNTLQTEIGIDRKISEAQECLNKLIELNSEFYLIDNLPDSFRHDWTVFDFFLSGFKISKDQKVLTAIECGLD